MTFGFNPALFFCYSRQAPGEVVTVGAGCYWGTEKYYRVNFQKLKPNAITFTAVGFMGPDGIFFSALLDLFSTVPLFRRPRESILPTSLQRRHSLRLIFCSMCFSVAHSSFFVCKIGHVEVLHFKYDPKVATYEDVIRFFFSFHDPTTSNRQGNGALASLFSPLNIIPSFSPFFHCLLVTESPAQFSR